MALASRREVRSFALITTRANELCAELHDRITVILSLRSWPARLGEEPADSMHVKARLGPYPSEEMTCWTVSPQGGQYRDNDPRLIEPIAVSYDRPPQSQVLRQHPDEAGSGSADGPMPVTEPV